VRHRSSLLPRQLLTGRLRQERNRACLPVDEPHDDVFMCVVDGLHAGARCQVPHLHAGKGKERDYITPKQAY